MHFVWSWTLVWLVLYHAFLVKSKTFPILFIIWKSVLYLTLFNDDTVDIIGGFLQLSSSSLDIMFDFFFRHLFLITRFQVKKKQFFRNFMTIMLFGAVGTLICCAIISIGTPTNSRPAVDLILCNASHILWSQKHQDWNLEEVFCLKVAPVLLWLWEMHGWMHKICFPMFAFLLIDGAISFLCPIIQFSPLPLTHVLSNCKIYCKSLYYGMLLTHKLQDIHTKIVYEFESKCRTKR